jgi:hypothetical protein
MLRLLYVIQDIAASKFYRNSVFSMTSNLLDVMILYFPPHLLSVFRNTCCLYLTHSPLQMFIHSRESNQKAVLLYSPVTFTLRVIVHSPTYLLRERFFTQARLLIRIADCERPWITYLIRSSTVWSPFSIRSTMESKCTESPCAAIVFATA